MYIYYSNNLFNFFQNKAQRNHNIVRQMSHIPKSIKFNNNRISELGNRCCFNRCQSTVYLWSMATDEAAYKLHDMNNNVNVVVHNFANCRRYGGGYRDGKLAQEEDLCRRIPALFASLGALNRYMSYKVYPLSRKEGDVIVTPNIDLMRYGPQYNVGNKVKVNVVTAAAPDLRDDKPIEYMEHWDDNEMKSLTHNMYVAPKHVNNELDAIVLGAWGCGVFKNNPTQMANLLANTIKNNWGIYTSIVFAIPDSNSTNFGMFGTVLKGIQLLDDMNIIY